MADPFFQFKILSKMTVTVFFDGIFGPLKNFSEVTW